MAGNRIAITGSLLTSRTVTGTGDAGTVIVLADERLELNGGTELNTNAAGTGSAGDILLTAPELRIEASMLASSSESVDPLATDTGAAGNVEVSGDDIAILTSVLSTTTAAESADPASLVVAAGARLLVQDSELSADTLGAAAAGDVLLRGTDVDIVTSQIFAESFATGTGNAGNVEVSGERITITDSLLSSRTVTGTGDSGTVVLRAGERLALSGETEIDTNASGTGTAGDILLSAPDLLLTGADVTSASGPSPVLPLQIADAARALSAAFGVALPEDDADALLAAAVPLLADTFDVELPEGAPRDQLALLLFFAEDEVLAFEAALPFRLATLGELQAGQVPPPAIGGAGAIRLEGARIVLEDDALVSAITAASAGVAPGVVEIEATESIRIDDAVLESDTIGAGDAGDVFLSAPRIDIARASLFAESFDTGRGNAGNVIVEGGDIHVTAGSLLASRAQAGVGDGGNVILDATGTLRIDGGTTIESSSSGSGDAGLVFATAPDLEVTDATLRSASERFEDTPLLVEFALVLFDRAFGTTLEAATPETFIAAVTPLFEDALDIDLAATEPAAFVAELERKADQDDLETLFDPLPIDPEDLRRLTDAPRLVDTVGDAGVVSLSGERITLSGANLSTVTAATEQGIPSDVVLEATERLEIASSTIEADTIGAASAGNITLAGGDLVIDSVLRSRSTNQAPLPLNLRQVGTALGIDTAELDANAFLAALVPVLEAETGASLDATSGAELLLQLLARGDLERIEALEDRLAAAGSNLFFLELLKAPVSGELGGAGTLTLSGSSIRLSGAELTTEAASTLDAAPASILLVAEQDLDLDASLLTATTSGLSRAGDIELSGARLELSETLLTAESLVSATGDAGSVSLSGDALGLTGSTITSRSTSPTAAAGSITLRLANAATLDAGSVLTTSSSGAGAAGDIDVSAATLLLREGALILSESEGTGASGSINLELGTRLDMFDSRLSTNALRARGGDIVVRTLGSEIFLTRSRIEASAGADGRGGDVLLDSDFIVLEESALLATAVDGNGGQIDIFADAVVSDFFSTISADSETGNAGTVNIEAPDNDMNAVVAAQDASPLVVPELVSDRCAPGAEAGSRLIVRPSTPVRSLPESPRSLDALEARLEVSALLMPCAVGGR